MNIPQAAWGASSFVVGLQVGARQDRRGWRGGARGRALRAASRRQRIHQESKVQNYVKTFADLAQRRAPAARTELMMWQDATDDALAGGTR
jgi:hypothetical protein